MNRRSIPGGRLMLALVMSVTLALLGGCGGGNPEPGDLYDELELFYNERTHIMEQRGQVPPEALRGSHSTLVGQLNRLYQDHEERDAPEDALRALASLIEIEEQLLANPGNRQLQQEAEEYWSHLGRGELPPGY